MVNVDTFFGYAQKSHQLRYGLAGAAILHALLLVWFTLPSTQTLIAAETLSPPTHISIRFVNPVPKRPAPEKTVVKVEPLKVVKPAVKTKPKVVQKQPPPKTLARIEPAAGPVTQVQPIIKEPVRSQKPALTQPPRTIIPVVSGASLKGRRVQPEYPKRSLRMRQEGVVWLRVLISDTGTREEIKLFKPSQYALLNQAAIKAVKKWTFDPNIVNGRAVRSWVEIPIEFRIQ